MQERPISLSVVIMAYNERDTIADQVRATLAFFDRQHIEGEVIAVDDGSTDGTGEVLDKLALTDHRVHVVHHGQNLGMGMAIRTGYQAASKDFVTQLPGDAQVTPETLTRFLPLLPDHDLVLSKYAKRWDGLLRFLVTRAYWLTAWLLLGHRCDFTGTMMFRRSLLSRIALTCRTFMVNVEVPLKLMRLGIKPAFVFIEAKPRSHGRTKVLSLRGVKAVLREMLSLRREIVLT